MRQDHSNGLGALRMTTNSPNPTNGDSLPELVINTQNMATMFNQGVYTPQPNVCFTWDKEVICRLPKTLPTVKEFVQRKKVLRENYINWWIKFCPLLLYLVNGRIYFSHTNTKK